MSLAPESFGSTGRASGTLPLPDAARLDDVQGTPPAWAVVFAGGIGSRFWPLATPATPKPVLPLVGGRPLVAESIDRLDPLVPADRVLVVTSADIAGAVRAALPTLPGANLLVEERPIGTASALAWGVAEVQRRAGEGTIVCAMHADLAAAFPMALREALRRAGLVAARERALLAIAARPRRAEPSFGYLRVGATLDPDDPFDAGGAAEATQFVEKPGSEAAAALIRDGALWHAGMFVARAGDILAALALYTPEVAGGLRHLDAGDVHAFSLCVRPVSIERGLLERVGRLLVAAPDFGWDDVGTWAGLRRVRDLDDAGNGALGRAHFIDATGNVVHADEGVVVAFGVSQLLIVTRPGLTFVTSLERAADLKPLLDSLPGSARIHPASLGDV
ncbi:MAG TPA: sugar phosphate nucleotidyltransferase [Gemmatimonadaceae bacterium]|nr:sugar phosphate nucleotidyltransferase [Gemmatimonadaceae bacterium]